MALPNGYCKHLDVAMPDGKLPVWGCKIYETRPALCRVDEGRPPAFKARDWHAFNASVCNEMQERDGMDAKYRLPVVR